MKRETVQNKFGELTEEEFHHLKKLHANLQSLTSEGVSVSSRVVQALEESIEEQGSPKDKATLRAIVSKIRNGKLYPEYDLFRSNGRAFIYQVSPNIPGNFPSTLFDLPLGTFPCSLSGSVKDSMLRLVSFLDKGYQVGPIIGTTMYLIPQSA